MRWVCLLSAIVSMVAQASAHEPELTICLALQLSKEGDLRSSAIEFRRLGMTVPERVEQSGYFWAAAHQYLRAGVFEVAETMLDAAEDAWPPIEPNALLLRAETAGARNHYQEEGFFWKTLLRGAEDENMERLARRRLAAVRVRENRLESACALLLDSPESEAAGLAALEAYERGRDKRPAVGGLFGMIPGMGYAYAGEYANAFRSLILNALFIYGMVDTAQNDHWGGFAVITFFEITWYTGSIYGGIDASHRYNQRRLERTLDEIKGDSQFQPDWEQLPTVSLRFAF